MNRLVEAVGRIASKVAQRFLKLGPADEPVAWLSLAATALLAYQEAQVRGLGPEDAIAGAVIAAITVLVRNDVTPSAHLAEQEALPEAYFPTYTESE